MLYFSIFMTGLAGFLLGIICAGSRAHKECPNQKCAKNCRSQKCEIEYGYGDFFDYDGSERA